MKKFIVALILVAVVAGCLWADEDGNTEETAYEISSYGDFIKYKSSLNSGEEKYYKLNCDLQLTKLDELIAPVYVIYETILYYVYSGDELAEVIVESEDFRVNDSSTFKGHFDGQGHTIYVDIRPKIITDYRQVLSRYSSGRVRRERVGTTYWYSSLFGAIAEGSDDVPAVKNLHVGGRVEGLLSAGITSWLKSGRIEDCKVSCDIATDTEKIEDYLEVAVEAVASSTIHSGGIVANMDGGKIIGCDFSGNVATNSRPYLYPSYAGGIAGVISPDGTITDCNVKHYSRVTAQGNTEEDISAGGIAGYVNVISLDANGNGCTISGCTFEGGEISSDLEAGGIVGTLYGGKIEHNTVGVDTRISAGYNAGGIVGLMGAGAAVYSNDVTGGYVEADSRSAGGIAGLLELGTISDNYSQAAIRGNAASQGGVVGEIHNHYGTTDSVTGNEYRGSDYAIGLNEHMSKNVEGDNTRLYGLLYFEGNSTLNATENTPYDDAITMSFPATVDISPVPSWMSPVLNGRTITLKGIPTSTGTEQFTLTASYGYQTVSRTYTVNVAPQLRIVADDNIYAKIGDDIDITLDVSSSGYDISHAAFSWSVVGGTLPSGLSLNENTGRISGEVIESGIFSATIQVTPENVSLSPVSKTITINVDSDFTITTDSPLPSATAGQEYSLTLSHDAAVADPVTWEITSGSLPGGFTLSDNGTISGTTGNAGEYPFIVRATAGSYIAAKSFTLTVLTPSSSGGTTSNDSPSTVTSNDSPSTVTSDDSPSTVTSNDTSPDIVIPEKDPVNIKSSSLPDGLIGESYRAVLVANPEGVRWSQSGGIIPPGLTMSNDGVISGVPSVVGDFYFNATASHESCRPSTVELGIKIARSQNGGTAHSSGGGGGGCNSGGFIGAILAGIVAFIHRKR